MSVLVLDGDTLPALAITRSLGKKGLVVNTASHLPNAICEYSKYSKTSSLYPNPLEDTAAFTQWVEGQLNTGEYDLVVPATERTLVPIARYFEGSPSTRQLAMPALRSLEAVLDKSQTHALARDCGIPQPKSWDVRELVDIGHYKEELIFPLVIKPGRSISDTSQRLTLTVRYAHNYEELVKICSELLEHVHLILQEYFQGVGVGIELIAHNGELLYAFQHQRLHEMPLSGGGSSYRKSVEIDPLLLEASKLLIKALDWQGVAMVEFKKNIASGKFILIEINGRFWGSLPLAVAAGADFPYMLYQLYTEGAIQEIPPYRKNICCRKLSSDLAWLEAVVRKDADKRLVDIPSVGSAIGDLGAILSPSHYFDAQTFSDPKPGLVDLKGIIFSYFRRLSGVFQENRHRKQLIKSSHFSRIQTKLSKASNILFLCYGNINRSALAESLAKGMEVDQKRFHFKSAGFHPIANRPADSRMVAVAEKRCHDLSTIRSSIVNKQLTDWADLIFVMETEHMDKLLGYSDSAFRKSFLLGGLLGKNRAIEIPDPYNKPVEIYESVYEQINQSIITLNGLLRKALPSVDDNGVH